MPKYSLSAGQRVEPTQVVDGDLFVLVDFAQRVDGIRLDVVVPVVRGVGVACVVDAAGADEGDIMFWNCVFHGEVDSSEIVADKFFTGGRWDGDGRFPFENSGSSGDRSGGDEAVALAWEGPRNKHGVRE